MLCLNLDYCRIMSDIWADLEHQYSSLFVKNGTGSAIELYGCPGWVNIVVTLLDMLEKLGGVQINLIKEKWGCIRIQSHTVQSEVAQALCNYAMTLSEVTCCECGRAGSIQNHSGYYLALCSDCKDNMIRNDPNNRCSQCGKFEINCVHVEDHWGYIHIRCGECSQTYGRF